MLQEKLDAMKAAAAEKVPPEIRAIMQSTTEQLAKSDILDGVVKVGDPFPDFSLADASGQLVKSTELRQQGPLLINIYRGVW